MAFEVPYLWALTTGAKIYYLDAAHVYPLAAGAVAIDGWLQEQPGRTHDLMSTPPPSQRASAAIFTADYSEAEAVNELAGTGLPTAVNRQNSEWWWGTGDPRATTMVAVAPGAHRCHGLHRLPQAVFASV